MKKKSGLASRRNFLKTGLTGFAGAAWAPAILTGRSKIEKKSGAVITRKLGKTGLEMPIVSMGVMNADNPHLVKAALDAGIKMLDTANVYQMGRNETMIGDVIKDLPRDSFYLATKIGASGKDRKTGLYRTEKKKDDFLQTLEVSLKRLQTDYVDILYLHNLTKRGAALYEPAMEALRQAKKDGKARFVGVTTHSNEPEVLQAAIDSDFYDVVLTAYNFQQDHRQQMDDMIAKAVAAGIGIVAMKTLAGAYWDKERQDPINTKAALKWALANPNVCTAIPGMTTFDQLELDMSVQEDIKLSPQEKKDLKLGAAEKTASLYCQQCNSCAGQCSKGLDIPTLMRGHMYMYGYRNLEAAYSAWQEAAAGESPCRDCESCSVRCIQKFNVKERVCSLDTIRHLPADYLV